MSEREDAALQATVDELERACAEIGRDPATLRRSLDVFSVASGDVPGEDGDASVIGGSPTAIADALLTYGELGFSEARISLLAPGGVPRPEAIASMEEVVERVHEG